MSNLIPLTESEIKKLVDEFYTKLDAHAPVEEYVDLFAFAEGDIILQFPGITLKSWEQFKAWYEGTLNEFFDEIHAAEKIDFIANNNQAHIKAIVHWEASRWKLPDAHSQRIVASVDQSWVVIRSPKTQKAVFKEYIVNKLNYLNSSTQSK